MSNSRHAFFTLVALLALVSGATRLFAHHSFAMFDTANTIKKGDKITAVVSPIRSGEPGSLLNRITLADGRVLGNGGPVGIGPGTPPSAPATGAPAR